MPSCLDEVFLRNAGVASTVEWDLNLVTVQWFQLKKLLFLCNVACKSCVRLCSLLLLMLVDFQFIAHSIVSLSLLSLFPSLSELGSMCKLYVCECVYFFSYAWHSSEGIFSFLLIHRCQCIHSVWMCSHVNEPAQSWRKTQTLIPSANIVSSFCSSSLFLSHFYLYPRMAFMLRQSKQIIFRLKWIYQVHHNWKCESRFLRWTKIARTIFWLLNSTAVRWTNIYFYFIAEFEDWC